MRRTPQAARRSSMNMDTLGFDMRSALPDRRPLHRRRSGCGHALSPRSGAVERLRGEDVREVRQRLGDVAARLTCLHVVLLGEEPEVVARLQRALEALAGLVEAALLRQASG